MIFVILFEENLKKFKILKTGRKMNNSSEKKLYIIGSGFAGQTIADDIKRKKVFGKVQAFLDDDKNLIGTKIDGIPVNVYIQSSL